MLFYCTFVKSAVSPLPLIYLISAFPLPIDAALPCFVNTCIKKVLLLRRLWTEMDGIGPVAGNLRPPEW